MSRMQFLMPCRKQQRECVYIYRDVRERRSKLLNWREHLYGILSLWNKCKGGRGRGRWGVGVLCTKNENKIESLMPSMITFIEFWRCIHKKHCWGWLMEIAQNFIELDRLRYPADQNCAKQNKPRGLGMVVEVKYKSNIVYWQPRHKLYYFWKC
jgi:hypothetical protein